ncbi:MAG: hypothetical protein K0U61_04685 [Alphaproteobacteria bacterium]|nr:hypothetical protein [Alphaproteobacteria bacterium]
MGRDPNDILREEGAEALKAAIDAADTVVPLDGVLQGQPADDVAPATSEEAIALRFAATKKDRLKYVAVLGAWFVWIGSHWQKDETGRAFNSVRAFTRLAANTVEGHRARTLASAKTATGVEKLAKVDSRLASSISEWDRRRDVLATPSGTITLSDRSIENPRPEDKITRCTAYKPGESWLGAKRWLTFLDEVTCGDKEVQAYLQRLAGYCLTGDIGEHAFVFLYGTGRNGKGTFTRVLSQLMGSYAVTANMDMLTEQKHASHPTELARLAGVRLVTAQETEANRNWAEARIKQITGGDPIDARFMRQDFFTYEPQFKLILSGNHKPLLRNVDPAMMARLHIVPFNAQFDQTERNLDEKLLTDEGPEILSWMIEGSRLWHLMGLRPPLAVTSATADYFKSQDLLSGWLEECCMIGSQYQETSASAYASWTAWMDGRGKPAGSQKGLAIQLKAKGMTPLKLNARTRGFQGFALKTGGRKR